MPLGRTHQESLTSDAVVFAPRHSAGPERDMSGAHDPDGADRLTSLRGLAEQDREGSDFHLNRVRQLETWRRLMAVMPMFVVLPCPNSSE